MKMNLFFVNTTISATIGALTLGVMAAVPSAHAFQFQSENGVTGSFDTTISLGVSKRMQAPDPSLISITNGGTNRDPNGDDGNLNYEKGDMISTALKATHELDIKYNNYGFFARGTYFYDIAVMNKDELDKAAKDRSGRGGQMLDAYVRGNFDVSGKKLNVRAGRQVVSWGESTFILNGINVVNPVDVSKLRVAGAELKEGLIPTGILWASQELSEAFTMEAYIQANYEKTKIDPRGTFFSTNDFVGDSANIAYTGFGRRNDAHGLAGTFPGAPTAQLIAPRSPDRTPSKGRQFGLAFRSYAKDWNSSEFGFYAMNYHSRTPFVSGYRGGITAPGGMTTNPACTVFDVPTFGAVFAGNPANLVAATTAACASAAARGGAGTYFIEYPEDIRLFGLSFNTQAPAGIALQGEYSYRPNQPVQLPSAELLLAALGLGNQLTSADPTTAAGVAYNTEISGYRRMKMHQLQTTATKAFGQTFGAEQLVMLGEVGVTYLDLPADLKFSGPGAYLPQPGSSTSTSFGSTSTDGFVTSVSWGYRLVARMDYPDTIGGATLSPRLVFTHDVRGVSPTFTGGNKSAGLGLAMNFRQVWQADIAYTTFFGGKEYSGTDTAAVPAGQAATYSSNSNLLKDRDFLAVSVSYSF